MAERTPRKRAPSLRGRITRSAAVVVAVALVVGAALFAVLLRVALVDQLTTVVETDVESYLGQVESSGIPADLDDPDDGFVVILSDDGRVLAGGDDLDDLAGVATDWGLVDGESDDVRTVEVPGDDSAYLAASDDLDDDAVVVVGRSLETVDDTVGTVVGLLAIAVPLLVALVALTTWVVVGRTLAPVERMRRQVDEVSATHIDRRVQSETTDDEIGRLATTMNAMLDRLEGAQHAQRRFTSDASHELKSPLASLRQYAEVARAHPDRVSAAELTDVILSEGARLERLVQGMLLLTRADEHAIVVPRSPTDLDDIVLAEVRRLRESTSLTIDSARVAAGRVLGDHALLQQAVRNLADNAARHARSTVAFELGGDVLFAVDDDGPGIPQAERERVFDRFVRLDEARARDSGGSGLGLAIVREIVTAHGGSIVVTSSALGGARVELRLPQTSD